MPERAALTAADRETVEAALAKLRAEGGNLLLEMQLEAAFESDGEAARLRGFIQYALDGPDDAIRTILQDALDGVTGADDCHAIRARHGRESRQREADE